jgi:hypothetical protein
MYPYSQIIHQFVRADFRTLMRKVFCFAFGYMGRLSKYQEDTAQIGRDPIIKRIRVLLGSNSEGVRAKSWCTGGAERLANDIFWSK